MDNAIEQYRERRAARIANKNAGAKVSNSPFMSDDVMHFYARRDKRLMERGLEPHKGDYWPVRMDAPGDDENNNNNNGGGGSSGGGSHGNTRLPFGLCRRFGIEIGEGWTPRDAWDALAGKGITPDGAYDRLKKGEDPGTPDDTSSAAPSTPAPSRSVAIGPDDYVVTKAEYVEEGGATGKKWVLKGTVEGYPDAEGELISFDTKNELLRFLKEQGVEEFEDPETGELLNPKEMEIKADPKKRVTISDWRGESTYEKLSGKKITWATRGADPWRLYGDKVEGPGYSRMMEEFATKADMLRWLKEQGVEEFVDPETGEVVNPKEMELPKAVFKRGKTGYSEIGIGLRDGRYTIYGKDMDGKKKTLRDFGSLKDAKDYIIGYGGKEEDIKLSPALKKREKERLSWKDSKKKKWVDMSGKQVGDLKVMPYGSSDYLVRGSDEDGSIWDKRFKTKAEALKWLKEQGVESVSGIDGEINPQEYEPPPTMASFGDREFQRVGFDVTRWGEMVFYGVDMDGRREVLGYKPKSEDYEDFKERMRSTYSVKDFSTTEDEQAKIDKAVAEEEEKKRRIKEFEAKAVEIPGRGKYADIKMGKDPDGDYFIEGYDKDGKARLLTGFGDFYDMEKEAERFGLDINNLFADANMREEYNKYKEGMKDFEAKAIDIAGDKYRDIQVLGTAYGFALRGFDHRGRFKLIADETSYEGLEKTLAQYGYTPDSFTMDNGTKQKVDKVKRSRAALATGGYYSLGQKDAAYTDIRVEEDSRGRWTVKGTDVDGKEKEIINAKSWEDAIDQMGKHGVADYKIKDRDGKEMGKPTYGMHKIMLMRKPGGGYVVFADSKRFGDHAVMYETPNEDEARKWLRDNNVPDSAIKTRGMNPNDDVPRTHTQSSLRNFDKHRAQKVEGSIIEELSDEEKKDAADMLTTVFSQGKLRSARGLTHFGDIIETGYKSQIETGTGGHGACLSKSARKRCSEIMYGHGGVGDTEYEKMGYVGLDDDAEDYNHGRPSYGEMTFTFKKDRLNDRLTYTYGDSLNTDDYMACAGYGGDKPTIEGLTSLRSAVYIRDAISAYKEYKRGEITYTEMFDRIRGDANNGYIEIQMHGPVTVADIDKATFYSEKDLKAAFDKMGSQQRKRVIKLLQDNNVKVVYRKGRYEDFEDAWDYLRKRYPDDFTS